MKLLPLTLTLLVLVSGLSPALARQWTDVTGKYRIEAEFVDATTEEVRLKTADGKIISVPIAKMCEADRRYIESQRRSTPDAKPPGSSDKPGPSAERDVDKPVTLRGGRAAIEKALLRRSECEFDQVALDQAVARLSDQYQIPIFIAESTLADFGIATDAPLTAHANGRSLEEVLNTALPPLKLGWTVCHDVLLITEKQDASSRLETRVYVLLQPVANADALITQIERTVAPDSWAGAGGAGKIAVWPAGGLAIWQSYHVHREFAKKHGGMMRAVFSAGGRGLPAVLAKLGEPAKCDFADTPLSEVAKQLAETHRIPMAIDERQLNTVGIGTDVPVTCRLSGVRLESLLTLMLGELDLTWVPDADGLLITTPEEVKRRVLAVRYSVSDIMRVVQGITEPIRDVLTKTVEPQTWQHAGGYAKIVNIAPGFFLIEHDFHTHRKIERVLNDLRLFRGR